MALPCEFRDWLWTVSAAGVDGALAGGLAGGEAVAPGKLSETLGAHRGEQLAGSTQLLTGVRCGVSRAAQPLA